MHTFHAYAKINLGLHVLDKRPDGYHSIETVFHRINLFDKISFDSSPALSVRSSSGMVPSDERNICFKAAELIRDHLGIDAGVRISIQKTIPVGAGLGGGSSDAAGVLLHLPSYWGKTISKKVLLSFALQLGSDVPYFMNPGSALAKGRGEILEYFTLDIPHFILLCYPNIRISTAWAYKQVTPEQSEILNDMKRVLTEGMIHPDLMNGIRNSFEPRVFSTYPEVREVKETMLKCGATFSLMSGSGSSVYGFFPSGSNAEIARSTFSQRGYFVSLTNPHFQVQ